jgi:3-oxoacyl-(acyl-carrier-protein) synthase
VVVLEEFEHALARGAHIYAEIKSFASVSNSYHMTDLPADGVPMAIVVQQALDKAGLKPEQIDYINAHGSSTPQNDIFETPAYKVVFKEYAKNIPISSTKSMIGHSLSSASLMGVINVLGSIRRSIIHPTINYEFPDEQCDLDYVPNQARQKEVNYGLVTASGFGGIHSSAVLGKYNE